MVTAHPRSAGPAPELAPDAQAEPELLRLDEHTFRDLEILESASGGTSLFEFCNLTRCSGGALALKRRMQRPWSSAARIRSTQEALSLIHERRRAFDDLPSLAYTANRTERYTREIYPVIIRENAFEFAFGAFDLLTNHRRVYGRITRGVQFACRLIRSLRRFVEQAELESPAGDLAPVLDEMRVLLALPRFSRVPDWEIGGWGSWRILRLDQIFRFHEKDALARLLKLTYEIDALVALADVTHEHGFVLPDIEDGPLRVEAEDLIHPLVEDAVSNPVELDQERRVLFLTGPNMAGKTTYLRAFATALYLAHLGAGVPARRFRFVPAQQLFSSISLSDDLHSGISYFRAEALRVKAIAEAVAAGYRVVALMDEPFKGTNVKDALDASLAILERLAVREECLFMFSSHLIELNERLSELDEVDCRHFEADEGEGRLRFAYSLRPGVSSQRLGMRVLQEEGIFELLDGEP